MRREHLTFLGKIGVCLLALWALIVILPDVARVFVTYDKLDVQADNNGHLFGESDRKDKNLWIDAGCTDLADRLVMFGGLGGVQYVRPDLKSVALCVYRIDGGKKSPSFQQQYTPHPAPLSRSARMTLALDQLFGVLFILCGAFLVLRSPSAMTWGFYLYAIWFNPGQNYVLYAELQRWPMVALAQEFMQAIALALGYGGFVVFALRFPTNKIAGAWRYIEIVLWFAVPLLALLHLWGFMNAFGWQTARVTNASYGIGIAIDVVVLAILAHRWRSEPAAQQQKTQWVFWGSVVGLSAFLFADSNTATDAWTWMWNPSETTLNAIFLLSAALPISVFHAIIRYRVIPVSFALSRKITRVLLWLIVGGIVVELTVLAEDRLKEFWHGFEHAPTLVSVAVIGLPVAALIALKSVVDWLHEKSVDLIEKLLFRRLLQQQTQLSRRKSDLEKAEDEQVFNQQLATGPFEVFNLASAALFRSSDNGAYRRIEPSHGWPTLALRELKRDSAPITSDNTVSQKCGARPAQWDSKHVGALPADAAFPSTMIPLFVDNTLVGLAFYSGHAEGYDLNEDELSALDDFVLAACAAYQRIELRRLRSLVKAQTEELERFRKTVIVTTPGPNLPPAFSAPS